MKPGEVYAKAFLACIRRGSTWREAQEQAWAAVEMLTKRSA